MTANSIIDAMVESGDKSITATFRNLSGIALMDIVRLKNTFYTITGISRINRRQMKIEAYEA